MEDPDEMEMPVKCRCGEWFDLHDGFSCKWKNETVCESCHELQTEIEDLKEEIMDMENDIANDIQKRDNKRRLKLAKEELKKLENQYYESHI